MTSRAGADGLAVQPGRRGAGTAGAGPARTVARRAALVVVAGGLFGWLGAMTAPEEHVARAVLVVVTVDDEASAARSMATQLALITGDAVLGPVAERARIPLGDLARTVDADLEPEESLLRLDVTAATATRAREIATDVVTEYLTVSHTADVPAEGLARVRLVIPPHEVAERRTTAGGGTATGATIGLGVALATAAITRVQGRRLR